MSDAGHTRIRYHSSSLNSDDVKAVLHRGRKLIYTAGRPPWYDSSGQMKQAFVIGLCGGSGSGKTTVAKRIITALDVPWVSVLSMDSFYKDLTNEQRELALKDSYDFDHPDAMDFDLCVETLRKLKDGKQIDTPIYNFVTHSRETATLIDLKVFVDTDADVCLSRRLRRDITERGRSIESVLTQYLKFVKPAFDHYIFPTMSCADIIIPRGVDNEPAVDLIVKHVQRELHLRGFKVRSELINRPLTMTNLPESLHILEQTKLVRHLHTIIRDVNTPRDDFIFYSKRLMRLLFEYALSFLPFEDVIVKTPQGIPYKGKRRGYSKICAVPILRAGETMEHALLECVDDVLFGVILIQTSYLSGEPELHYLRLPEELRENPVFVLDATVATGAAAIMAVRVLLDHGVLEQNISVVSLLMAAQGYQSIAYAFPKVTIVTTAVDQELSQKCHILPGIGNFGDRYYGTGQSK